MSNSTSIDVYVGIGSNIDPGKNLREALAAMAESFGQCRHSCVYQSPPYGFEGDDFLNMVVKFSSHVAPEIVEERLSAIEYSGGRKRNVHKSAPRTLDLDLLLYGQMVEPALRLPRDDVLRYPFVLAPLAEIAPGLEHPLTGQPMRAAWASMRTTAARIVRYGPSCLSDDGLPADAAAAVDG